MMIENKETELLSGIGKLILKYLDYVFVFFTFPLIFDIRWTDPKLYIALGSLIIVRALMPGAKLITTTHKELTPELPIKVSVNKKEDDGDILFISNIDSVIPVDKIDFTELGKINVKKAENEDVVISFPDFRTLRLKKNEISHVYQALLRSEFTFFKPGSWTVMIKIRKK
jgi:hypothetical protein